MTHLKSCIACGMLMAVKPFALAARRGHDANVSIHELQMAGL